jgi:protein associated with RNAse G/E
MYVQRKSRSSEKTNMICKWARANRRKEIGSEKQRSKKWQNAAVLIKEAGIVVRCGDSSPHYYEAEAVHYLAFFFIVIS